MHVTAIIAAGGRGQRFGGAQPKQLLSLGGAILERSVDAFLHASRPSDEVVVALPADLAGAPPRRTCRARPKPLRVVAGGERRQDSVANAFRAVRRERDVIVIHDAARPFASADLIARTIAAAAESGAALAAAAGARHGEAAPTAPVVRATLRPRETIFLAQTPQAFRRDVLRDALGARDGDDATDEATLAERAGHAVRLVEGEAANIKITTPEDLAMAEAIARGRPTAPPRAGLAAPAPATTCIGSSQGRPLILGGVTIPFDRGRARPLRRRRRLPRGDRRDSRRRRRSATSAGIFPTPIRAGRTREPRSAARARSALVARRGYEVGNVDVDRDRSSGRSCRRHVDAMRANARRRRSASTSDASASRARPTKASTRVGRGEAIAAHAVALLNRAEP